MKQSVGSLDRPLLRSSLATMAAGLVAVIVVVAAAAPRVASAAEARARAGADGGTATRAPSAARGRQLFMTVGCVHCHGSAGQGSNSGTRLAPDPDCPVCGAAPTIRILAETPAVCVAGATLFAGAFAVSGHARGWRCGCGARSRGRGGGGV